MNAGSPDFNPTTAHLKPTKVIKSNTHILKMLFAAGAELEYELFISDETLQDLTRKSIREHLKKIHPQKNLHWRVPHLVLPRRMQSYLLFYTPQKIETNPKDEAKEFLSITSKGDTDGVLNLIQAGVDVNVQDEKGMTALMTASQVGPVELVEELIKAGASVNIRSTFGDTALIWATEKKQLKCVEKLLEFGANVNIQGRDRTTALMCASYKGNEDSLKALIEYGANPDIQSDDGVTALMIAIPESFDSMENLLRAEADVNLASREEITALVLAVTSRKTRILKKLIEAGADMNKIDKYYEYTPLMIAAACGYNDCIMQLIRGGADVNIKEVGVNINGADVNIKGDHGRTAMMIACYKSRPSSVTALIKAGAEVNTTFLANVDRELLLLQDTKGKLKFSLWRYHSR